MGGCVGGVWVKEVVVVIGNYQAGDEHWACMLQF